MARALWQTSCDAVSRDKVTSDAKKERARARDEHTNGATPQHEPGGSAPVKTRAVTDSTLQQRLADTEKQLAEAETRMAALNIAREREAESVWQVRLFDLTKDLGDCLEHTWRARGQNGPNTRDRAVEEARRFLKAHSTKLSRIMFSSLPESRTKKINIITEEEWRRSLAVMLQESADLIADEVLTDVLKQMAASLT